MISAVILLGVFNLRSCQQSSRLFWAQMALASLVPFQGPKKSRFSGPTLSNAPRNDVAPLKTITYRAIKTTGILIVIQVHGAGIYLARFPRKCEGYKNSCPRLKSYNMVVLNHWKNTSF
jgi:hypothetical protein